MEENEVKNEVQIAEEVIASIAGIAMKEVKGVAKLAGGFAEGISEAFGKKNLGKGIKVEINDKEVKIEVNIIIQYGAKVPELAEKIQEKIIADVEPMTGFKVTGVCVKVQGLVSDINEEEKSAE